MCGLFLISVCPQEPLILILPASLQWMEVWVSAVRPTEVSEACLCCSLQARGTYALLVMLSARDAKSAAGNWRDWCTQVSEADRHVILQL